MMTRKRILRLLDISTTNSQLHASYDIDGLKFSNAVWYEDVDFHVLRRTFGNEIIDCMCFHIAAFEINKICSLRPDEIDWGNYSGFVTPAFREVWNTIYWNVWAQWRFENDAFDYNGPVMNPQQAPVVLEPIKDRPLNDTFLSFCGGGKDSLVSMTLLRDVGAEFGTFVYSASYYGQADYQHRLIEGLVDVFGVKTRHKQWIYDDFLDSPVLRLRGDLGVRTLTAAETPSSIFGALPYVLKHGYRYVALAHEKSADAPQVVSEKTGESINHQWGKSFEAERLINTYIQNFLVRDFDYFSILKPIYDTAIFGALRGNEHAVRLTHSCNIKKPWCLRCAKCLYVWLGYTAFLDKDTVAETFGSENIFDVEENVFIFRQLVGLESQLPFECIGEADEAALYMALAQKKGYRGKAFDACASRLHDFDAEPILAKYLAVDMGAARIPEPIRARLEATFQQISERTCQYVRDTLEMS